MDATRLDSLLRYGLAYDTETHLTQPGLKAPPKVVASAAQWDHEKQRPAGMLLDRPTSDKVFEAALADDNIVIIGANIAYDMLVEAVHAARQGRDLMPLIFKAYREGRVFDVQIAEMLHAIAEGTLGKDPTTGSPMIDPATGKMGRYSLSICTSLVLGRANAKVNDKYRGSYALLEHIPIAEWPPEARIYPVDDAVNTLEVALAQAGLIERPGHHTWPSGGPGSDDVCPHCGVGVYESNKPCIPRKVRSRNLHELSNQCFTAFAMHLGAAWGFTVDQAAVDEVERRVLDGRPERAAPFFTSGIFRWKRERNKTTGLMEQKPAKHMAVIKGKVARAYGCHGACSFCNGSGKVPSPKAVRRTCGKKCSRVLGTCALCDNTGERWDKLINCKPCDATGLNLDSAPVPRTDGGKCACVKRSADGKTVDDDCEECEGSGIICGIGTGRDVLQESGDEELINLAEFLEDAKIPETYLPWLREGRLLLGVDDLQKHIWKNIPLTLKPNVLLETGRTSYNGCVQLLPRKGGVRECIVARPGYVFCSVDYEAGELVTHAQSCIWLTGASALADALNAGLKVHNAFAASMMGISYEEFQRRLAEGDPICKAMRQAAKPGNFGFPGRMGAAKLVIQQRKQGPDTPCVNGTTWIIDPDNENEDAPKVRGYKGTRFCILMDGATRCGALEDGTPNMITEWKGRDYSPICKRCVECAERLRAAWLEQWPENVEYFDIVKHCEEEGQPLSAEQQILYGLEALKAGEIVQHVSNRIRGGKMGADSIGNAIANGWFQGLLADATKSALRRASREMYDSTFRLDDGSMSPLFGSRFILFAHDELIAELPEHCAHEAAMRLSKIMEEELCAYCPDMVAAIKAEPAIMRRWYKGAATWYAIGGKKPANANDRLTPWYPKIDKKGCVTQ